MKEKVVVGVPRVPEGMLVRPALRERLGRRPLTVVRAPGGSGKTVLLAQWASERRPWGAWVTVEPDNGDRLAFWRAVSDTAAEAGLAIHVPPDFGHGETLRGDLVRGFRGAAEPFVLVVDDAHEVRDPLIFEDLLALLRACPNVIAVVGTRSRSELEAPRQVMNLDLEVITPDELLFSVDDVNSIVGAAGSPYGTTVELREASGGNPLLLRAILAGSGAGRAPSRSPDAIVDDYLEDLFARRGAAFAAFAAATAVPDDVDLGLAEHLGGESSARVESMLASLETDGLVMLRETADGVRYRYHPLVRDALRAQLREGHPKQYRRASLLASAAAEARRLYLPALRHAVEAEDYARASDVCLHGGFTLLRSRGAAAILQQVPLRAVARLPFLAVVLGLAANARGERLKALELLALALGVSRALRGRQRIAERAGLALVETVILRITGRASEAVGAARRMMTLLDEAPPADLEEIADQLGSYRLQGAVSLFRAGQLTEARLAAERVGASADALERGRPESLGAAALIAAVEAARGDCRTAGSVLAIIDGGPYPAELRDGYLGSLAHLARGILALEAGDADAADRETAPYLDRENLEHGTSFAVLGAFAALWRGAPELGLSALEHRERSDRPRARLSPEDRRLIAVARVLLHASVGQTGAAHAALRGLDRTDAVVPVLRATVLLLEQRPDLAVEELNVPPRDAGPRLEAAADILRACAAFRLGDERVAEAALRRFVATATVHGTLSAAALVPAEHRTGLWELAERIGVGGTTLGRLRGLPAPFRTTGTRASLTRREREVLIRLRATPSQAEIAATLSVSTNTVRSQVRTLYRKLGVSTRDEALRAAYLQGLLGDEADEPGPGSPAAG